MIALPEQPCLRPGLEWLGSGVPGEPDAYLLRDPQTGRTYRVNADAKLVCSYLDGRYTMRALPSRVAEGHGCSVSARILRALVRQLAENGLLAGPKVRPRADRWSELRVLNVSPDRLFDRLLAIAGWASSWPATLAWTALAALAMGIVASRWQAIWHAAVRLAGDIGQVFRPGGLSVDFAVKLALAFLIVPMLREVCKGVALRRAGLHIQSVRVAWIVRFLVPRLLVDVSAVARMAASGKRWRVAASGLACESALLAAGIVGWEMTAYDGPARALFFSVALVCAIQLAFQANPLGRSDAALLLSLWLREPNLRERAVRVARAFILCQPAPEPLAPRRLAWFRCYGLLADAYGLALNVAVLWLLGYALVRCMGGVGAALFCVVAVLRFDREIGRDAVVVWEWLRGFFRNPGLWRRVLWTLAAAAAAFALWTIRIPYDCSGEFRIQPSRKHAVCAEVGAQIEAILVREGDAVTNGQVVARLVTRVIRRDLDVARATLEREQSQLRDMEAGAKPEEIAVAQQRVQVAQTALTHSLREYERAKQLHDQKHIPDQEFDARLDRKEKDEAELAQARSALELVKSKAKPDQLNAQKAEVERLQKLVAYLEGELDRTVVRTGIAGRVSTLFVAGKVGQMVNPGDAIASVENTRPAVARVWLPEEFAGRVRPGAAVRLRAWAYPDRTIGGSVTSILPAVVDRTRDILQDAVVGQEKGLVRSLDQPSQNVVPVLAELPNADGMLLADMTGFAKIRVGEERLLNALLDPFVRFFRVRVWSWLP